MNGKEKLSGSQHYLDMAIQPWDVFSSMHMLWEHNLTTAIKYVMRAPTQDLKEKCREDLVKAMHEIQSAVEVLDENS